jgi:glycosyltransferase involved in cell wall biosynthesis
MNLAILLPVRNGAKTIKRAIDSIENQTFFKNLKNTYKIYLVDNMSSDNLKTEIQGYKNLINFQSPYLGIGSALNAGLYKIQNDDSVEYVARMDQDDVWHLDKIETQMDFLTNNKHIDICGTQMHFNKINDSVTLPFEYSKYPTDDKTIKEWLMNGMNPLAHSSIIYKKYIFNFVGGYDDTYKYAEDLDLWLKCLNFCSFANINKTLVEYFYEKKASQNLQDRSTALLNIRTKLLHDPRFLIAQ